MTKDDLQKMVIVRLFQVSNALQTYMDYLLKADGLTAKQFFMMIIIGTFDSDPKLSDIAERFGTSHQNVKQVLLKLKKAGFIQLYKDQQDSRITRSRFTNYAQQYWHNRNEDDENTMNQIFQTLDIDQMNGLLGGLVETLEQLQQLQSQE